MSQNAVHAADQSPSTIFITSLISSVFGLIQLLVLFAYPTFATAQDVTTWHYNNARTGVQSAETTLTPANVNPANFGKVFSLPVLGELYAQPLYLRQYPMSDGKLHNVLLVATTEDYLYAFDADGKNPAQGYLWRKLLVNAGETWLTHLDENSEFDIYPNIGIIGTPVINRAGGTIYVVSRSKTTSGTTKYFQRLHALNIANGAEKLNGPTTIQATVNGLGDGGTTIAFNARLQNQRPALLLAPTPAVGSGTSVFIAWASHGDQGQYHGWVMAYDAANIAIRRGAWVDTPNGEKGGIWMSAGGLSTDGGGNIFASSGNGTFNANKGGSDYGDSAFRMILNNSGLALADYFTPGDQVNLNNNDRDMGTSAVTLLPTQSGPVPRLGVVADKTGEIYLLNLNHMGGFVTPGNSSLQSFAAGNNISNSFAFFNNALYVAPNGLPLQDWTFDTQTERLSTTPHSRSGTVYGCRCPGAGATPSISANGTANGIAWALDNVGYGDHPAILHAYNAANLATELYNSTQAANNRDAAAIAVKFTTPTIANGRVYVGGRNAVTVYGLRSNNSPLAATPVFTPASGTYGGTQNVTIKDSTPNASIYYTTDGSAPSTGSKLYSGPIPVSTSETIQAIAIAAGFSQSPVGMATYTISALCPTRGGIPRIYLCSPANGATVASPVRVLASAIVTGTFARMEVWADGVKKYTTTASPLVNISLSLAPGAHRIVIYAVNTAGTKEEQPLMVTVAGGGTCSAPTAPGVNVCKPVNASTVASPVAVQAAATVTGTISRMEVWVDGVKKFSTFNSRTLSTSLSLVAGSHRFAFYAVNAAGTKWMQVVSATVH